VAAKERDARPEAQAKSSAQRALASARACGTLPRVITSATFLALLGWKPLLAAIVALGLLALAIAVWGYRRRQQHLTERYGDPEIARRMMKGVLWQGETAEQVRESLGEPADIDQKVLKTKTKEVWKYRPTARNRFGLKVTLDDGVVTGWEQKD
jgi:hypothetical protein